jgi:hypothetical protein
MAALSDRVGAGRRSVCHVVPAARHDGPVRHDAIQDDIGEIAIVGDAGKPLPPQECVEASIE